MVYADDKSYEKKDRNVNEPLQFYSGKDPALFEIVVNSINSKNQISGYLSTPKNAPVRLLMLNNRAVGLSHRLADSGNRK